MATDPILLVGFDGGEADALAARLQVECIAHEMLPRIVVERGELFAPSQHSARFRRVSRVVFHGIFEHDVDFLAGLALWGGPCFPNPVAMLDCRLRLPGLVKALRHTRFGGGPRGFAFTHGELTANTESVAKWGNWHCGENKERFTGIWTAKEPTLFEPFVEGEAVRVVIVGQPRQIRLTGKDWLKSVHGDGAAFMPLDAELAADTLAVQRGLGLDIIANDYIVSKDGPYLLEVNHIPSVTCFPELWEEYQEVVVKWASGRSLKP
ncbi:ATP-grasp domain-containing protein [Limnoglobus roseus]|uniref:ATP-grasp fold RimK-type domain-containing protein n=1 Tax=Limnoglobus roseus TaxID=2598579 RepID=A0A5C1A7Y4_9BACT|nr:hypothetical protein [Limnoglobus roseus]QEL14605.1 hypothetical protein PX52LOC_01496 [Limnoglobus roseus]